MSVFIPVWIIGAPFLGILFLSFAFGGSSSMGANVDRLSTRREGYDPSVPLSDPMAPSSTRRI
jgi:hypothetical protein